jgi:hypothetical protein
MADTQIPMTPEEYDSVTAMVKSPGWRLMMERVLVPEFLQATRHVDNVNSEERTTQLYRGAKLTLSRIVTTVYRLAKLPNPLDEHYLSMIAAIRVYTADFEPPPEGEPQEPLTPHIFTRPKRVSRPVL